MVQQSRTIPRGGARTTAPAVVCTDLTKDYGGGHGVFNLDLSVQQGETFGFIGPNGAGKTTRIRLLMDLIRPDRGAASLLGMDARRDSLAIKRKVGYLPGELVRFPGVSAGYVIGLLAGLRGCVDPARIAELAERFELDLGRRYEDLSHGNKQKVGLRLRRVGTLNDLRALRIHHIEAVFNGQVTAAELGRVPGVTDPRVDDHHLSCAVQGSVGPLLRALSAAAVVELDSHELSLEEVFLGEFEQPPGPGADN